jgi:hypothetical protein
LCDRAVTECGRWVPCGGRYCLRAVPAGKIHFLGHDGTAIPATAQCAGRLGMGRRDGQDSCGSKRPREMEKKTQVTIMQDMA